ELGHRGVDRRNPVSLAFLGVRGLRAVRLRLPAHGGGGRGSLRGLRCGRYGAGRIVPGGRGRGGGVGAAVAAGGGGGGGRGRGSPWRGYRKVCRAGTHWWSMRVLSLATTRLGQAAHFL